MNTDYANPTALGLGKSGMLDGRRYAVRGRTVLSVDVDGETYYWNEFNLVDDSENAVTLVYEDTEDGPAWKLFKLFEPLRPLSAMDAAAKQTGDWIDLSGSKARISLVDQSRIVYVDGQVPEGVAVGVTANYFNAENGDRMIVVSWSGEEVECYEGGVTSARRIEGAFGLPHVEAPGNSFFGSMTHGTNSSRYIGFAVAVIAMMAGLLVNCGRSDGRSRSALPIPQKRTVSAAHIAIRTAGALHGRSFRITGHARVEIARLGDRFDEHEYAMVTPTDDRALLVRSLQGKSTDWYLLTPAVTPPGFTPFQAAGLRQGHPAIIGGRSMQVIQVFQIKVLAQEGNDAANTWPVGLAYGLLARNEGEAKWMLARWTESGIETYNLETASDDEVRAAFGPNKN